MSLTCGTNQSAQGVTCDVPGFPDIGGADDGPQGWQRAANEFLGNINYPLASLPVLSCGSCVPNTQVVGEHALYSGAGTGQQQLLSRLFFLRTSRKCSRCWAFFSRVLVLWVQVR